MPNLKDIRRRIKSVKNTQKITQAMRMVAAAKVKRAENRVKAARPYAGALVEAFHRVAVAIARNPEQLEGSPYQALFQPRPVKTVAVVVVSADRGLCGAYAANVQRQAFRIERDILAQGLTPKFYLVGNKAIQAFKRYSTSPVLGRMGGVTAVPSLHDAHVIAQSLLEAYLKGDVDRIEILSTGFRSMISYEVGVTSLLPITEQSSDSKAEWLMEPDPVQVLNQLVPMYVANTLYRQLLEASASEHAARMTAMTNATKNAGEMIDRLTVVYNKARQASITQEILEVVSGAQALA
jgi:F-type H+-transporting ATPase subunit gamma